MPESVDPERLLLSWCIQKGDLLPLITEGITPEQLEDEEHALILEWALGHYREHGVSPGVDALRLRNPNYRLAKPTDDVAVYIGAIRERQRYNLARDAVQLASTALDKDEIDEAVATLTLASTELAQTQANSHDEDITLGWEERFEFYRELRSNPGQLRGLPTGFHTIDRATNGIQKAQFIVIAGPPGCGKSTMAMTIGKNINVAGREVLLISFEMSAEEQKSRWDAIWGGVNYKRIMEGRTTRAEMEKIQSAMQRAHNGFPFYLSTDIARTTTVSGVAGKIEKFKPDLCIVDGVYLMQDDRGEASGSPQALKNITEDFKRLCQTSTCPVVATTQTNTARTSRSRGVTADSVYGSQGFHQNADVLLLINPADDEEGKHMELRVGKSRHGPLVRAELEWSWNDMTFEERYEKDWGDDDGDSTTPPTGGY